MALQYDIGKRIIDKMTADTPADDALRAAVESARLKVDVATSYLADAYQSQRQSADLTAPIRRLDSANPPTWLPSFAMNWWPCFPPSPRRQILARVAS